MKLKYLLLIGLLMPVLAFGQNEQPKIYGAIPNKAGGEIVFTSMRGKCQPGEFMVYTKDNGGRVGNAGCYSLLGNQLVVKYGDGDVFSYSFDELIISEEWMEILNKKNNSDQNSI
jgi:hypothetical protein